MPPWGFSKVYSKSNRNSEGNIRIRALSYSLSLSLHLFVCTMRWSNSVFPCSLLYPYVTTCSLTKTQQNFWERYFGDVLSSTTKLSFYPVITIFTMCVKPCLTEIDPLSIICLNIIYCVLFSLLVLGYIAQLSVKTIRMFKLL